MNKPITDRLKLFFLAVIFFATPAFSQPHTRAELLSDVESIQAGVPFLVGVHLTMDPGWHTYWKTPGDSGLPTKIDWTLPTGFKAGPIQWPAPEKISMDSLMNYGYQREVLLLTEITPAKTGAGKPVTLKAKVTWLECEDECIPGQATVDLTLPMSKNPVGYNQPLKQMFDQWQTRVPVGKSDEEIIASLPAPVPHRQGSDMSLMTALLFAFIGGLLLNLMPCVLPVLSIKVLSLVKQAQLGEQAIRRNGIFYSIGVVLSFLLLAAVLIVVKYQGQQLGWGFQLQSPAFLLGLSFLFFLLGLNLFGVFEVGTSLIQLADKRSKSEGFLGAFSSGVLATIVATPCTGPFMGSALGFSLTQPSAIVFLIFLLLGLGMAFPFLLMSFFPAMSQWLPKPGAWMNRLKQCMGFLLVATTIWLIHVLIEQTSAGVVTPVLSGLLGLSLAAWIYGQWGIKLNSGRTRIVSVIVAVALVIGSFCVVHKRIGTIRSHEQPAAQSSDDGWMPYSDALISDLKKSGKPFFIDFTASWCLTCQVNEKGVLALASVQNMFKQKNVTLVRADWTKTDNSITQALNSHGRNGVPLYVLYNGTNATPTVFPSLLTPSMLMDALEKIK